MSNPYDELIACVSSEFDEGPMLTKLNLEKWYAKWFKTSRCSMELSDIDLLHAQRDLKGYGNYMVDRMAATFARMIADHHLIRWNLHHGIYPAPFRVDAEMILLHADNPPFDTAVAGPMSRTIPAKALHISK